MATEMTAHEMTRLVRQAIGTKVECARCGRMVGQYIDFGMYRHRCVDQRTGEVDYDNSGLTAMQGFHNALRNAGLLRAGPGKRYMTDAEIREHKKHCQPQHNQ